MDGWAAREPQAWSYVSRSPQLAELTDPVTDLGTARQEANCRPG